MANICIIGAGQLGSRHLQALKGVKTPLSITVVDPFPASLKTAQERYDCIAGENHKITYASDISTVTEAFDLVIVATNSNVRREVVEQLLSRVEVKYMILEKLLFQKKADYETVGKLLAEKGVKTWVNCSMRAMTFYADLPEKIKSGPLSYLVSGSNYGMITNVIHYIDHIAYLTGCYDFEVITSGLDRKPMPSKRAGFLELNGTLVLQFADGSNATFTCFADGDAPFLVEIHSKEYRCIVREAERKAWQSCASGGWVWEEVETVIPYQSQMTNILTESLLKTGDCSLVTYKNACKLHLQLLESLCEFLNEHSLGDMKEKCDVYPFT